MNQETAIESKPNRVGGGVYPFILIHVLCLAGIWIHPTWETVTVGIVLYAVRMFGITAGYHRYFSHRTFKTSRAFQFVLAVLGTMSAQKGVLWWAGNHRNHHKFSDQPEDLHSPLQSGFWWSHMLWFLSPKHDKTPTEKIQDFAKYPELRWLNEHFLVPPTILALAVFLLFGWSGLVWGFLVSTVLLWHGTFTINSLSHVFGKQRYRTTDTSRNNWLLALITMGEGWHNNHHYFQSSVKQGFFWWEVDMTYYILRSLNTFGVVWDLKKPPVSVLHKNRVEQGDAIPALNPTFREHWQVATKRVEAAATEAGRRMEGARAEAMRRAQEAARRVETVAGEATKRMEDAKQEASRRVDAAYTEAGKRFEEAGKRFEAAKADFSEAAAEAAANVLGEPDGEASR